MTVNTGDLVDFSAREIPGVKITAAAREEYFGAIGGEEGGGGEGSGA